MADYQPTSYRIGHGYDLHRLEPKMPDGAGKPFIICGIEIDHDLGTVSHSDGDAVYHAVTDAILGALGQPDIGQIFPDTSPKWADADSSIFVREAVTRCKNAGYSINNIDITIILQNPKIGAYKDTMRMNLAELINVTPDQINLKGKTHENLDDIGAGKGIAVHCVVLLYKP